MLHVETVGSVTSPVTHVDVVAVKSASKYGTLCPVAELIGNAKRILPIKITPKKLNKMICVVENLNLFSLCKVLTSFPCFMRVLLGRGAGDLFREKGSPAIFLKLLFAKYNSQVGVELQD